MRPLEFMDFFNASIIRAKTFDALLAFLFGKEAGGGDVVVQFPVNERRRDNSNQSTEKENSALILAMYLCLWVGMSYICQGYNTSETMRPRP